MTDFVSIDDMIDARQQVQPGFKKGGQPLSYFKNRDVIAGEAADKAEKDASFAYFHDGENSKLGHPDAAWVRTYDETLADPKTAVQAWKNKQEAIASDAADDLKASDPEGEKAESEEEITEDEVKEADTPEGKEDVRVGTEEAAAREDKAKAMEALGKAKEDEERAEEAVKDGPKPDIDSLIAGRQWAGGLPPMDFDIIGEDAESLTVRDPKTGETFIIPKG